MSDRLVGPFVSFLVRASAVLTVALTFHLTPLSAACPSFATAANTTVGTTPKAITIGDFTGDGIPDLAVANSGSNTVTILIGNGSGGFTAAVTSPSVGTTPVAIAAGDFNRDGKADLVVANSGSDNVSILIGNGDGTFASATNFSAGTAPAGIAIADFNGDGKLDVVVANHGSDNVSILLGNGSGGFGAASNYGAGTAPNAVAVADFDRNGKLDLAVANGTSNDVSILSGAGDGTFGTAAAFSAGTTPWAIVTGDFDGNGNIDLAVANKGSNNVSILFGNGSGSFAAAVNYAAGTAPAGIVIGDFNADGVSDLAVADSSNAANTISILLGVSGGTFGAATTYSTGTSPAAIVVGDFDRDGRPDLAAANSGSANVSIVLNNSFCYVNCGTYPAATLASQYNVGSSAYSIAKGDFNRDGKLDLAVVAVNSPNVQILLGNGDGTFAAPVLYAVGNNPEGVAVGDFNGDGILDLAVTSTYSVAVSVLAGNGDGTFGTAVNYTVGNYPIAVVVGDFNRDGKLDIASANLSGNSVSILLGDGSGGFATAVNYSVAAPLTMVTGDVDRDGILDLVFASNGGYVQILKGQGDGTFSAIAPVTVSGGNLKSAAVGDFNGDGKPDLAVTIDTGAVLIYQGNGNGTFGSAASFATGPGPMEALAVGDLNGDGKLDLVFGDGYSLAAGVLLGNGDGTFGTATKSAVGGGPRGVVIGDFNGDGKPDLALAVDKISTGTATILLNSCPLPDLTITKTHSGSFTQNDTGKTYSITVNNIGGATFQPVTVVDTLPSGLTATALAGTGWACTLGTLTCTRSDVLTAGSSYPTITLTVNVAANAPSSVTNNVSVSGGGESVTSNDSASDLTAIVQVPDLTIAKSHSGNFTQGQIGATYTLTVSNGGAAATSGNVTVVDVLPSGLSATGIGGTGWNCTLGTLTCTRSDALATGNSYPDITVTVNVANNAPASASNTATVSGGGETLTTNDSATDPTTINQLADLTITKSHAVTFTQGQSGRTYTMTVHNGGSGATSGTVTVVDTLPTGLTATDMSGTGWSCTLGTLTCTRSDVLAAGSSYPDLTLTVTVANNAAASLTNSVAVSGGGEVITNNDSATDPTTIIQVADLTAACAHTGNFTQGQGFRIYTITIGNVGPGPTSGTVTVGDLIPTGLTPTALRGTGWACSIITRTCTRSDVLASGSSYPAITLTVDVADNAAASIANTVVVSGGGELNAANDTATDPTTINVHGLDCASFSSKDLMISAQAVATGDVTGDGIPDLVLTDGSGVTILPGLGDGTFSPGSMITMPLGTPQATAIGDFNNDGFNDLAVTDAGGIVWIALNNGDGTFATPAFISGNTGAGPIIVRDLNGDGKPDLVVVNGLSNNVSVFLGQGGGAFATNVSYAAGTSPSAIAIGDVNGDNIPDLVVANSGSNNVSVLSGNGDGTFAAAVNYAAGTSPGGVAVADLNGDGKLDVIVANSGSDNISLLAGNGNGTFAAAVNAPAAFAPSTVIAADLDHDGKTDVVVLVKDGTDMLSTSSIQILPGNGNGTFGASYSFPAGFGTAAMVVADFNGDGKADLFAANANSVSSPVLLNGCPEVAIAMSHAGNFVRGQTFASYTIGVHNSGNAPSAGTMTLTDTLPAGLTATAMSGAGWLCNVGTVTCTRSNALGVNGTSMITLTVNVASNAAASVINSATVSGGRDVNLANNSATDPTTIIAATPNCGTFAGAVQNGTGTPITTSVGQINSGLAYGDVDGDGIADLIVAKYNSGQVSLLKGNGNGTFSAVIDFGVGSSPQSVAIGDFNGDGKADLAVVNRNSSNVSILLATGSGGFASPVNYAVGFLSSPIFAVTGDFNEDGFLDIAVAAAAANNVYILYGKGDGTFSISTVPTGGGAPVAIAVGDFNGDGHPDLAVANAFSNNIGIILGGGLGTTTYAVGSQPDSIVAGDFNGDGKIDLAVANNASANISVLMGNGNGTFAAAVSYSVGTNPQSLALGDFNGDGKLDLAVGNVGSMTLSTLLGVGDGTFAAAVNMATATVPQSVVLADVNGDGNADLVFADNNSASVWIQQNSCPLLTITKTHSGNFTQGQTGKTYTITVTNAGTIATTAPVTVVDTLPSGLTATAIAGTQWNCDLPSLTCTRSDALAGGASYPAITLTVNVSPSAPTSVTNTATVTGGAPGNNVSGVANDPTTINVVAGDLTVSSTHAGNFTQGENFRTYTLTVTNLGPGASVGTVTVTDTLPAGLTAATIGGAGWSCVAGTLVCTRSDSLLANSSFPAITLSVNVAADAPSNLTNSVTVAGGGESNPTNDSATDPTTVNARGADCGIFAPAAAYAAGTASWAVAIADFNHDGNADLAVVNDSTNNVSILLGNGNGTFASAVNYAVEQGPTSIATGDFNGDGNADLVVTNTNANTYSVLLGNGNGTFSAAINITAGIAPIAVAAADFNGDGLTDLAVVIAGTNTVSIALGTGGGTFAAGSSFATGSVPYAIAVADFNGDGKLDLAVANSSSNSVSVLLGNGNGTFGTKTDFSVASTPAAVAIADFNGDGKADLAVANGPNVSILAGFGNGTFAAAVSYPAGTSAASIAVADFNHDGKPDLAVANNGSNDVSLLIGNGNGTFATAVSYAAGTSPRWIATGDLNGDGRPDLVTANQGGNNVSVLLAACPDLTVTKTHSGSFTQNQSGATYSVTATNSGSAPTLGTVSVTDVLPNGLTATAISGAGWNCTLGTLTCTRSDKLAANSSYPSITVTVTVSSSAAASLTNTATVAGGGELNSGNDSASDPTTIVQLPDLTITKTHAGNFTQGQSGATYTITVRNSGSAATSGSVTVVDTLPAGLTATSMAGTGWSCTLATLTCVRSDALAASTNYPVIAVTVNVASNAAATVTNVATVSGGAEVITSNDSASDPTTVNAGGLIPPTNVSATANSTSQVTIAWNAVANAVSYQIFRSTGNGSYALLTTVPSTSFPDASVSANTVYRYFVKSVDAGANVSAASPVDIATTVVFTDDPLVAGSTVVKAIHLTELRNAVNLVRTAAGLTAATFTDSSPAGVFIKAVHITELRTNLDTARSALGATTLIYTDPSLTTGDTVKAAHLQELRAGIK